MGIDNGTKQFVVTFESHSAMGVYPGRITDEPDLAAVLTTAGRRARV